MNERLRQLMLEAGYAAPEIAARAQTLAHLIVKDCVKIAKNPTWYNDEWRDPIHHACKEIEEAFKNE